MESGSNDNVLAHNDCTHGGDGIFVRVLNQWVSTGNRFEENDCSYANNNCIEAWSPRNLWIRNRANHGSYGFWLGASDQNVLIDNEASYNGQPDGNHNSPHLPNAGHAGIVFMFGPSSHTIVRGNRCEGNNGAGIAAIGDLESKGQRWQAFHWIIEQNQLRDNRWGVYLQYASMIDLAANTFERNAIADVARDLTVMEFVERSEASPQPTATRNAPPVLSLEGPSVVRVGESSLWTATARTERADATLHYRWLVPGSGEGNEPTWTHTFSEAGFYRLALTVDDGYLSDLAWRDLYVVDDGQEMATESPNDAQSWSVVESDSQAVFTMEQTGSLVGDRALHARIDPYSGGRVTLQWRTDAARRSLGETTHLVFWLKTRNEHVPSWQDVNPLVSISDGDGNTRRWRPVSDRLSAPVVNEAREGWMRMAIPLAGDADWIVEGSDVTSVNGLSIGFDSWGAPPLEITIDGLTFVKTPRAKHGT